MNRVRLLNNSLNIKYQNEADIVDHISEVESNYSQQAAIGSTIYDSTKAVLSISSLNDQRQYRTMIALAGML